MAQDKDLVAKVAQFLLDCQLKLLSLYRFVATGPELKHFLVILCGVPRGGYMALEQIFVSASTNKRHHHHLRAKADLSRWMEQL